MPIEFPRACGGLDHQPSTSIHVQHCHVTVLIVAATATFVVVLHLLLPADYYLPPSLHTYSHSFYEWSSHTCTDTSTKLWQRTCETVIVILQPPAIIVYMHWQVVPSLLFLLYGKFSLSCIRKCIQTSYRQANHWCWKRFFFIFMLSRHWLDKMNKNISRYCKSFMLKRVIEKLKLTRGNCRFWFIVNLTFILR